MGMLKRWLKLLLVAGLAVASATGVQAQTAWKPDRAVEIILGVSPGGPQDQMGRLLLKVLLEGRGFEVPVTAVNSPGGGGAVGLSFMNQRPGDGRVVISLRRPCYRTRSPVARPSVMPISRRWPSSALNTKPLSCAPIHH